MVNYKHYGPASAEAVWPLLALVTADISGSVPHLGEQALSYPLDTADALEIRSNDYGLRFTLRARSDEVRHDAIVQAWGNLHSDACWFPFGCLEEDAEPDALVDAVTRTKALLGRVHFYDQELIVSPDGAATAAVDYLRVASGVTDGWTISMAAPHELILNGSSIGEGDGLLLHLEQLPPGLSEFGECALIEQQPSPICSWSMRPVMCSFDQDIGSLTIEEARGRLQAFGFLPGQIEQLDRTADEVREAYAAEVTGELSGTYSG